MKTVVLAIILLGSAAQADFYQCDGFMGVDEYRAGIDMDTGKAGFFDNDTTTKLKHVGAYLLETYPPQWQYIYESEEDGVSYLKLLFNITKKEARLYEINHEGEVTDLGKAPCEISEPWDLEE